MKHLVILFLVFNFSAQSQILNKQSIHTGIATGFGKGIQTISIHAEHLFGKNYQFGYGVRYNFLNDHSKSYNVVENGTAISDRTLTIEDNQRHSINLYLNALLTGKHFFAGFNIDVLGFSLYNTGSLNGNYNAVSQTTVPVQYTIPKLNLLKVGYNDEGSLNSEFYIGYKLGKKLSLLGGVSHYSVQYKVDDNHVTDTFTKFYNLAFIKLTYKIWQK